MDKVKFEDLNYYKLKRVQRNICMRGGNSRKICTENNNDKECFMNCVEYKKLLNKKILQKFKYKSKYCKKDIRCLTINEINVIKLADILFEKFKLNEWTINITRLSGNVHGQCWNNDKRIDICDTVPGNYSNKVIENLLLHEIAHAIEYERYGTAGHEQIWKDICKEIGCTDWNREQYNHKEEIKKEENIFTKLCNLIKIK